MQTRVEDTAAIVALIQCLVHDLVGRYDAAEPLPVAERERISESMFLAARDGLAGHLPDLDRGDLMPTPERVAALADRLRPAALALGCAEELSGVKRLLLDGGGAARQREIAANVGLEGLLLQLARETGEPGAARLPTQREAVGAY